MQAHKGNVHKGVQYLYCAEDSVPRGPRPVRATRPLTTPCVPEPEEVILAPGSQQVALCVHRHRENLRRAPFLRVGVQHDTLAFAVPAADAVAS